MKLIEKFSECQKQKKALLATNFYNFETLKGVLLGARKANAALILQLTESSINYMGLENAIQLGRSALKTYGVEGWIHLDHGGSFELADACLKAGVDSVMIDGSELSFEDNIKISARVVKRAKDFGAAVEAELGYVAKLGQNKEKMEYTKAEDAKRFVAETGVDSLAVAIGTAHGFYKEEPKLDIVRLKEIQLVTPAYLVLHGSSGVPDEQIKACVQNGICKINLATEIKNLFMQKLKSELLQSEEIDLRKVFPPAIEAVSELVAQKIRVIQ